MFVNDYKISEACTIAPSNMHELFQLHNHDDYEIFLFLKGDAKYIVENKTYCLEPFDIIIVKKHELHRVFHNNPVAFHRKVLFITSAFLQKHNCLEYEKQMLKILGTGNKIPGKLVRSSGLYDAFERYRTYSKDYVEKDNPVLTAIIIEILYLISQIAHSSTPDFSNSPINSVISFLNENYTEHIDLDMLQEKFFISKHYLCRGFRKATGLTILEYVRKKRLVEVQKLHENGLSLLEAAVRSGFNSYSSFYRAHQKEFGYSPNYSTQKTEPH